MKGLLLTAKVIAEFKKHLILEERSAATIEKYVRDVTTFAKFTAGVEITKETVIAYKKNLQENYAVRSVNSILASINGLFSFLGWHALRVKSLKLQQQVFCSEDKELTKAEYTRLCKTAEHKHNERLNLILQTICGTGIRVSELKFITVESVKQGEAVVSLKGKTRSVFIVKELKKKLLHYAAKKNIKSGMIFITRTGNPISRTNIWREMKSLCTEANVNPGKVFPHNLRHLFARVFYGIEKDIAKLADIWAGVFMLRNLKSPETYFQTAFRVQSPWEIKDEHGNREVVKKECYVFDFALERALRQISDYFCRLKVDDTSPEQKVSEFISFLPVLAFDGSSMNQINAQDILDITYAGTSATLLAKRWKTALLVRVDNDTLKKLQNNQEALNALMNIEEFRTLNSEIQTIINHSEKIKKWRKEKGDNLTKQEKKELSEDEKKAKSLRKQVQENLLKLAARIPAFMYLTDYREQTIKDVITQIEPELFKKVTGLSVKDFDVLCSIGLFSPMHLLQVF